MSNYGNNSDSQIIAFGAANSSLDQKTATFRKLSTTVINSKLNLEHDIQEPSDGIHNICNLLTAAFLTTKPSEQRASPFWEQGIELLDNWRGDSPQDAKWRINIPVERFHGFTSIDDLRPHSFVS